MPQAVILAGGGGSRLFPVTSWTPKPLLPVRGVPILVRILRKLAAEGWYDFVICISEARREEFAYHVDAFQNEGKSGGVNVTLSTHPNSETIGTAGEVVTAARYLKDDFFLVFYGDILTRMDTHQMLAAYEAQGRPKAMVAASRTFQIDKGVVSLEGDVPTIQEKPRLPIQTLLGIDIFHRDALLAMEVGEDLHRHVVPGLLRAGTPVGIYFTDEEYLDIGSIDSLRRAQEWE